MKRYQRFLGRELHWEKARNKILLSSFGVKEIYLPEEPDVFEELEFSWGSWEERAVVFTLVLEHGRLARISLGYHPASGTEDDWMAFTEAELERLLAEKGDSLTAFLEAIFAG